MNIRKPAVSGYFYPSNREQLLATLDRFVNSTAEPARARAIMMPHAGYVYSGVTAGRTVAEVIIPDTVIVLCPKHTRAGASVAVSPDQEWQLPIGNIPVDTEMTRALVATGELEFDPQAHQSEHSLEVLLPFLWRRNPNIAIVPVALGYMPYHLVKSIAGCIARTVMQSKKDVLLVASSDMSHQIPVEEAARLDHMAISEILAMSPDGLYNTVINNGISMCGVIPVVCALEAAMALGAATATLVDYRTSADVTGDTRAVVGYAGVVIR